MRNKHFREKPIIYNIHRKNVTIANRNRTGGIKLYLISKIRHAFARRELSLEENSVFGFMIKSSNTRTNPYLIYGVDCLYIWMSIARGV